MHCVIVLKKEVVASEFVADATARLGGFKNTAEYAVAEAPICLISSAPGHGQRGPV
jgi:hypothetical protein